MLVCFIVLGRRSDLNQTPPILMYGVSPGLETHTVTESHSVQCSYTEHLHIDKDTDRRQCERKK